VLWHGDDEGHTIEENSGIFLLIWIC